MGGERQISAKKTSKTGAAAAEEEKERVRRRWHEGTELNFNPKELP